MDKQAARRVNPIAHFTLVAVLILLVFEGLIIFGALELRSRTVAKYAPWAYEPFLRLVGEHPESAPRWAVVEESKGDKAVEATVTGVAGLEPSAIPVLIETDEAMLATNVILEATVPLEVEPEPVPVAPIKPAEESQKVIPVG